jgi:hypothetical protein
VHLISSKLTFFSKRIFPVFWFGFIGLFVAIALFARGRPGGPPLEFLLIPVVMAVFGYFLMRKLVLDLVDEVWDAGDALVVRNSGQEERIPLSVIMNVSDSMFLNPPRVTLMLRQPCRFGKEVTFSPARKAFALFTRNPVIQELIERIDAARRRASH